MTIDARKKLNAQLMSEFLKDLQNNQEIVIKIELEELKTVTATVNTLRSIFEKQDFNYVDDDVVMTFTVEDRELIMLGLDYKWWNTTRRLNKLFSLPIVKTSTKREVIIRTVGVRYADGTNELMHTGTTKECVNWLNRMYATYLIDKFFKVDVELSIRPDEWKPFKDYVEEGALILK